METLPVLNGRILINIFETLSPALPSLQGQALWNSPAGYFSEGARLQWWQRGWGWVCKRQRKFAIEKTCI